MSTAEDTTRFGAFMSTKLGQDEMPEERPSGREAGPLAPASGERQFGRAGLRTSSRKNGRLLDLKEAEVYSGISAWTLRDLIASGELPAVRPPRLRRVWIDRADLDKAIAGWKDRAG